MAIQTDLPGVEITISVDEQPLKEYDTKNDPSNSDNPTVVKHLEQCTVTKFVESANDKEFLVQIALGHPYKIDCDALEVDVEVDGTWIDNVLLQKEVYELLHTSTEESEPWIETICGPRSGIKGNIVKPMKFSKFETST